MPSGTVKTWFDEKGFGFIAPDDGTEDIFVHAKVLGDGSEGPATLEKGASVEYEVEWDDRKDKYACSACWARERAEGDWDCADCGAVVAALKETCSTCERKAAKGSKGGKGGKAGAAGKGGKGGKGGVVSPAAAVQALIRQGPVFKQAWESYCDTYGEGWRDATKHELDFLQEFVEYVGGLVVADLAPAAGDKPAPAAGVKRPAAQAAAGAPPEKKKVTVKKSVAAKVSELNATGLLLAQIRLGAVAGTLAQLSEEMQLEALALLEEQAADIEDPNDFLKSQAQVMVTAAEEA